MYKSFLRTSHISININVDVKDKGFLTTYHISIDINVEVKDNA